MSTVLSHDQANEILARQVAEEIDTTGTAADGKVIFEGTIMSRSAAARIIDERLIEGRKSAMFDLQDAIEDALPLGAARLRLRTNILYGLGYRVVGALRDVVYRMNEHARDAGHIDKLNEFIAQISEAESGAAYAEQMGYANYGSGLRKAGALLNLFNQWRALCVRDAVQLRVKNELPELYALINQPPRYDASEADKLVAAARIMLEDESKEVLDEAVRLIHKKASEEHISRAASNKELAPLLERLLTEAMKYDEHIHFHDLPIDVQGTILVSAVSSAKKIPEQLAKMRSVSTMDMVTAMPSLKALTRRLESVLADPRFDV